MDGFPGPVIGPSTSGTGTVERASTGGADRAAEAAVGYAAIVAVVATAAAVTTTTDHRLVTRTAHLHISIVTAHHRQGPSVTEPEESGMAAGTGHGGGMVVDPTPRVPGGYPLTWATTNPPTFSPFVLVFVSV